MTRRQLVLTVWRERIKVQQETLVVWIAPLEIHHCRMAQLIALMVRIYKLQ